MKYTYSSSVSTSRALPSIALSGTPRLRWAFFPKQYLTNRLATLLLGLVPAGAVLAQAPTATTLSPTRNALTAAQATPVALSFSQSINPATSNNLRVFSSQAGGKKAGSYSTNGSTVTFDPITDFKPGETVFVTVPPTLQSTAGVAASKQVYQFTTATGGAGRGTFGSGSEVQLNGNPRSLAVGDIDGDGDVDILTANDFNNSVSIRLNNGTGSFSGNQIVGVGNAPFSIALSDVDGDGDLDLLSANAGSASLANTVSIRLNNGSGTFSGSQNVGVGNGPYSLVTSDVDGDGDLDILTTNNLENTVSIRLNDGAGSFSGAQNVSVGSQPRVVAVGDMDNDGDVDLLTTNNTGSSVSIRLNGGDATGSNTGLFSGGPDVAVSASPQGLAVGDVDGDGDLDLLAASVSNDVVSVRLNNGTGTFSGSQEVSVSNRPLSLTLGDIDADGDLDLLTSNAEPSIGTVSVRLNAGNGTFSGSQNIAVGRNPLGVTLADVDGDGDLDMLVGNYLFNTASVRLNQNQVPVPIVTGLSPAAELAGMPVTITGTNFTSSSSVSFGGVPATNVTFTSPTSLTAIVPVGAAVGNSAVVVTNSPGTSSASSPAFQVLKVYDGPISCLATVPYNVSGDGAWHYLLAANGQVVAALQDTRPSLGLVTVNFQVTGSTNPVRQDGRGRYYLDRNFVVTARNGNFPNATVNMRFYGLTTELARLQAVDPAVSYANLKTTQYRGPNEDCELANDDFINGEFDVLAAPASTPAAGLPWFMAQVAVPDHFSEFFLTSSASPLPVELTSFTAELHDDAVQLHWRTASEQNSKQFEVERSRDGHTFQAIGLVAAQGTSTHPTDYSFADAKYPADASLLYYRLRQVDHDGTAAYSPVRTVALGDIARTLRVFPNPAHSQFTVAGVAAGATVEVFDATGRQVLRVAADDFGTTQVRLPATLPAGVYLVRSGTQLKRLVVQ